MDNLKKIDISKFSFKKTMPNGECSLGDYNPPYKNLFMGDCSDNNTLEGCKGHTQKPGPCPFECGFQDKNSCEFKKTFSKK